MQDTEPSRVSLLPPSQRPRGASSPKGQPNQGTLTSKVYADMREDCEATAARLIETLAVFPNAGNFGSKLRARLWVLRNKLNAYHQQHEDS